MYDTELELVRECLFKLEELLKDLQVNNPKYNTAFDIGNNPIISFVSHVMSRNPMYFAEPVGDYVRFDIRKINDLKSELEEMKVNMVQNA